MQYPKTRTGPLDTAPELPVRMVTIQDARVITTALESYVSLTNRLSAAVGIAPLDEDVQDRIGRIVLELDAPPKS